MQKITPCLWFDKEAEEAVNLYTSLFKNSKITSTSRYDKASAEVSGMEEGSILTIEFQLEGQDFIALNGGTQFKFSGAISFLVTCENQEEVDKYWYKLLEGGQEMQCGWLTDKFGVTWQIIPTVLDKMLKDKDPKKAQRVMEAMLKMVKMDIKGLEDAYNQA